MKKYELTQEQINQLAEKKHAKELLKEFIPEAFEIFYNGKWAEIIKEEKPTQEEEVREALINEAIKRGYKKGVKCKFGTSKEIRTIETNKFFFDFNSNKLYLIHSSGDNADEIFRNGFWAEIVSEYIPTQEEIDRVINYLKNK